MNDMILLKQGEIVLKGLNRRYFEDKLISNAKRRLAAYGKFDVSATQSTVYIEPQSDECDMDGALEAMTKVFGVVGVTRALACEKDKDAMFEAAKAYAFSQEYGEARKLREGAGEIDIVVVEGV